MAFDTADSSEQMARSACFLETIISILDDSQENRKRALKYQVLRVADILDKYLKVSLSTPTLEFVRTFSVCTSFFNYYIQDGLFVIMLFILDGKE